MDKGATVNDVCANRHKGNPESVAAHARAHAGKTYWQRCVYYFIRANGPSTCMEVSRAKDLHRREYFHLPLLRLWQRAFQVHAGAKTMVSRPRQPEAGDAQGKSFVMPWPDRLHLAVSAFSLDRCNLYLRWLLLKAAWQGNGQCIHDRLLEIFGK